MPLANLPSVKRSIPVVVGLALLGVAGCGKPADPAASGSVATSTTPAAPASAQRQAAQLLAEFVPPPGAHRIAIPDGLLQHAADQLSSRPRMADASAAWAVSGSAATVVSYVQAHPPAGLMVIGHASATGSYGGLSTVSFGSAAGLTGSCSTYLTISVAKDESTGGTALRADGMASQQC